jgi:hypothetical protein
LCYIKIELTGSVICILLFTNILICKIPIMADNKSKKGKTARNRSPKDTAMGLAKYRQKRTEEKTPEPFGGRPSGTELR